MLKSKSKNPNGLHKRYHVTKADGSPCDPKAIYFVLRIDADGSDEQHTYLCRQTAAAYALAAMNIPHLAKMAKELWELCGKLELKAIQKGKRKSRLAPSQDKTR